MRSRFVATTLTIALCTTAAVTCQAQPTHTNYHLTRRISGPDGLWDLASVDEQTHRLFVGRQGGITALDLDDPQAKPTRFLNEPVIHQVLPTGDGRLLATTGESDVLAILQYSEPRVISRVPVNGHDPDSVAYDQKTGLAVAINRGSQDATLIDLATAKAVGSLALAGAPEFAVADQAGTLYVNIADKAQIAVIDLSQRKIVRTIGLKGCQEPSGLALDPQTGMLVSACDNGVAKFVTTTGQERASVPIGTAPDAAFIDAQRRLAFIPSAGNGTLAVISLADPNHIGLVQTVKTQPGTRTGAVDTKTGIVYLPTGQLTPSVPPAKWPSVVAGTFEILVISP